MQLLIEFTLACCCAVQSQTQFCRLQCVRGGPWNGNPQDWGRVIAWRLSWQSVVQLGFTLIEGQTASPQVVLGLVTVVKSICILDTPVFH